MSYTPILVVQIAAWIALATTWINLIRGEGDWPHTKVWALIMLQSTWAFCFMLLFIFAYWRDLGSISP